jgi:hypothetical protein
MVKADLAPACMISSGEIVAIAAGPTNTIGERESAQMFQYREAAFLTENFAI